MNGKFTYEEINGQPEAWTATVAKFARLGPDLRAAWHDVHPRQIILTGCGSTYYLAKTAARLLQSAIGVPTQAFPASELAFAFDDLVAEPDKTLLLAISRSGTTSETVEATRRCKAMGTAVWVVTCYPNSALGHLADLLFPILDAPEQSIAQTQSFTSMLIMCQLIAATLGDWNVDEMGLLPDHGHRLLQTTEPLMRNFAANWEFDQVYFLGSGPIYGIACEAMLKMTEMSLTSSQAFHFMEFRHGPMAMVGPNTLVVGLLSDLGQPHEGRVLQEMANLGAATIVLNPTGQTVPATWAIDLPDSLSDLALPPLYLPPLQLLGYHRAMVKGLDPDNPRHLSAVIELDPDTFANDGS